MEAISTILILGGLGALGYAGWLAYRRGQGHQRPEGATPLRQIAIIGVVILVLGAIVSPSNENNDNGDRGAQTTEPTTEPETTETTESQDAVLARASQVVRQDDYEEALTIVRSLAIDDRRQIRRAISTRLASRARSALRRGDRGAARRLLAQVQPFPKTEAVQSARASLTAAEDRARQRRLAAERRAAERRAQEQAEREAQEQEQAVSCESGYDPCVPTYPPDLDCGELGGPYAVTGSDPHGLDADRDGVGCE